MPDSLRPCGLYSPPGSFVHGILLPFPSLGDLPNPGIDPRSPALQADTLPSEPPGKLSEGREIEREGESLVSQCQGTWNAVLQEETVLGLEGQAEEAVRFGTGHW